MKEVVIAFHNKNYSWVKNLNPEIKITIYNKSNNQIENTIKLENIGRDPHTFFTHFVLQYDNLSDYTFTSQDYFGDHVKNYLEIMNGDKNMWDQHATQVFSECWFFSTLYPVLKCDKNGKPHSHFNLEIEPIWEMLFKDKCPEIIRFSPSCHICVTKNHVIKRPLNFYKKIVNILETIDDSPWVIERLMPYIFDLNYEIKNF